MKAFDFGIWMVAYSLGFSLFFAGLYAHLMGMNEILMLMSEKMLILSVRVFIIVTLFHFIINPLVRLLIKKIKNKK